MSSVAGPDECEGLDDRLNTDSEDTKECDKFDNDYEIEIPIYHKKQSGEAFGESSTNEDKNQDCLKRYLVLLMLLPL